MTRQIPEADIRERLAALEAESRLLEPTPDLREAVRAKVIAYGDDFLDHVEKLNAFNVSDNKGRGLLD